MTSMPGSPSNFSPPPSAPRLKIKPLASIAWGSKMSFPYPVNKSFKQICSLLLHSMSSMPIRHFFNLALPARCASKVSWNTLFVKSVFFMKINPPLIRPLPYWSQSSSVRKMSLPFSSRISAIFCKVLCSVWTSAASASNIITWVKASGLFKYSASIKCFSQLKFSRSFSLTHLATSFIPQFRHCQRVSWGCDGLARRIMAWP
mmetsp:Transcript_3752/g.7759  ORF Transcript_3752/g.7759 Transcript_3752/m.7759 type:complete len:203 (-) Transcript_3752:103-711(-)